MYRTPPLPLFERTLEFFKISHRGYQKTRKMTVFSTFIFYLTLSTFPVGGSQYTVGWEKFVVKFRSNFLKILRIFHHMKKITTNILDLTFFEGSVKKASVFQNSVIFDS